MSVVRLIIPLILNLLLMMFVQAAEPFITVASTTSTRDSGLFDHILPKFRMMTGIEVRVIAVGTGQAIRLAERGDADVLLVHDTASEEKFVADGFGVKRFPLMYNDFVLIGPLSDPATVMDAPDIETALHNIVQTEHLFFSRGDDSGTHKAELRLWQSAEISPVGEAWYRETGSGMGATLNIAAALDGYVIADRATWATFRNPRNLTLLLQNDPLLHNPYGVILVSPNKHHHIKVALGQRFIDWLMSDIGQQTIASFQIDGQTVFFPQANAHSRIDKTLR